jgi:S-adenosylmethionine hydrolase
MKHKTLAITTDFGDSFAVAQLHAVIYSMHFKGKIIENHSTAHFSVNSGAFEIQTLAKYLPRGAVNVGVIDPGVGSARRGIIVNTKNFWFVGPDNGLLYPAISSDGIEKVWKINEEAFGKVTNTFHGRDVFIKAAVYLAQGKAPEAFGSTLIDKSGIVKLIFKEGQVLHIDTYGNMKVHSAKKLEVGRGVHIKNGKYELKVPFVRTFADVSIGQPLAYEGSSHTLELAINQGNFAVAFNATNQDILKISQA